MERGNTLRIEEDTGKAVGNFDFEAPDSSLVQNLREEKHEMGQYIPALEIKGGVVRRNEKKKAVVGTGPIGPLEVQSTAC